MKNCKFINELNRLRKSSSDSIDNVEKFDQFKSYMHVVRKMEEDLKGLLRKVNASAEALTLRRSPLRSSSIFRTTCI